MTRKHFEAIAAILKEAGADFATVAKLAHYFESVNPNFNRARFYQASGYDSPVYTLDV